MLLSGPGCITHCQGQECSLASTPPTMRGMIGGTADLPQVRFVGGMGEPPTGPSTENNTGVEVYTRDQLYNRVLYSFFIHSFIHSFSGRASFESWRQIDFMLHF